MNKDFNSGKKPVSTSHETPKKPASSKRPLTPREKAVIAEKRRIEKRKRNKAIKAFTEKAVAVGVFALIGAVIALAIIFGYIFLDFSSKSNEGGKAVHISYEGSDTVTLGDGEYFYRNGEYFVSLTKLCKICPMTLHGNVEYITLSLSDDIYADFTIGSYTANICGTNSVLSNPVCFENGQFYAPIGFFTEFFDGITAEHSDNGKNKGLTLVFDKSFTFKASPASPLSPLHSGPESGSGEGFKADLSSYEKYMNPENKDDFLFIVSKTEPLSSDYEPENLTNVSFTKNDGRETQQMDFYAAKALEAMFLEMRMNGFNDVYVTKGYRSYGFFKNLYDSKVSELTPVYGDLAPQYASLQVSYPGTDEHQTGLCADLHNMNTESEKFASESSYKWLFSNCAEFGFILRYPKDKEDITGKSFSPWHFRYVGRYHAKKIMSEGLCLEEYIKTLN